MSERIALDANALERFLFVVEGAARVRQRHHLHLWARGALQGFVPHGTLACLWGDARSPQACAMVFADEPNILRVSLHTLDALQRMWREQSCQVAHLRIADGGAAAQQLASIGARDVLLHGMPALGGAVPALFAFFDVGRVSDAHLAYVCELLLPYLYAALAHVVAEGETADSADAFRRPRLSPREAQVLRWMREGKTNQEIGNILAISPLTVKNHVQKILRKLQVANRQQAARHRATELTQTLGHVES
ncbi:LuxR C-terminal-related transcriptional regulator [Uliginosibacterium sp. sgz301328]|uniref:helix-turn-helix transcriptional regulator n=1 Tax=Uliginosibacterium sp. sgz301328 TaxID=3243764 RepID=UPI00359E403A